MPLKKLKWDLKPPKLHLPDNKDRFLLYSDTGKFATGIALYQIQNGKPKLITDASKRMPKAPNNYSITGLEFCGLEALSTYWER